MSIKYRFYEIGFNDSILTNQLITDSYSMSHIERLSTKQKEDMIILLECLIEQVKLSLTKQDGTVEEVMKKSLRVEDYGKIAMCDKFGSIHYKESQFEVMKKIYCGRGEEAPKIGDIITLDAEAPNGFVWFTSKNKSRFHTDSGSIFNLLHSESLKRVK